MEETTTTMEDQKAGGDRGEKIFKSGGGFGVGGDDDIMLDIDGEDLIFPDDTFPTLPEFPCLPSPPPPGSPSPSSGSTCMHAKSTALFSSASTSSSSSSSSASWSFFQVPDAGSSGAVDMQHHHLQEHAEVPSSAANDVMMLAGASLSSSDQQSAGNEFPEASLDLLGEIDLFNMSAAGPWDPCSIFPDEDFGVAVDDYGGSTAAVVAADQEMQPPVAVEEGSFHGGGSSSGTGARMGQEEEENSSEDLSRMFLDWLRSNRDSVSREDLRSIKLKRATIDCAARRLGGGKHAKIQLVKLILTWVQNNHLQRKRRRSRNHSADQLAAAAGTAVPALHYHHYQPQPPPINPNPNQFDYNGSGGGGGECSFAPPCNSWIPYSVDPSTCAPLPAMMTAYGGDAGCGEMVVHPSAIAPNYCYNYDSSTSNNMVVDGQSFSPSPDFHPVDPSVGTWPSQFTAAATHFAPFPCASAPLAMASAPYGGLANHFSGHPMYQQGLPPTGTISATKEARKKRMARQRRFSSHRGQNQKHVPHPRFSAGLGDSSSRPCSIEAASAAGVASHVSPRSWAFWANLASSPHQMNPIADTPHASNMQKPPPPLQTPLPPQKQLQQQNSHRNAASASEKRQGWKSEKNLKFLLQKVLKQSDVGSLGRIVLPKKEAEMHLPELDARDGISIQMEDIGTNQVWNLRYRYWPNNKSRMYLLENTGDFVRSNQLQEGDFIVIYSDAKCGKYMIRGVKVRQGGAAADPRASIKEGKNAGKAHVKGSSGSAKAKGAGFLLGDGGENKDGASPSVAEGEASP